MIAFPPTAACPKCSGFQQTPVELSGRGEVLYVSHSMAPPPNPRFNDIAPYGYGHVKLKHLKDAKSKEAALLARFRQPAQPRQAAE